EMSRALDLFRQAAGADPSYAPAYSGIADASALLASWQFASPCAMYPQAVEAARRAIELDPSSADAHASIGFTKLNWGWDWEGAIRELSRAVELNPSHETAHRWLSAFYAGIGRDEDAVPIAMRAIDLNPTSVLPRMNLGIIHFLAGRNEEAIVAFRRVIEIDPSFVRAHVFLGAALSLLGFHEEAISSWRVGAELSKQLPVTVAALSTSLANAGRLGDARAMLDPIMKDLDSMYAAMAHASLGEDDTALAELEVAAEMHSDWMYAVAPHPWFRKYHGNPRFVALLRKMNLPDLER